MFYVMNVETIHNDVCTTVQVMFYAMNVVLYNYNDVYTTTMQVMFYVTNVVLYTPTCTRLLCR